MWENCEKQLYMMQRVKLPSLTNDHSKIIYHFRQQILEVEVLPPHCSPSSSILWGHPCLMRTLRVNSEWEACGLCRCWPHLRTINSIVPDSEPYSCIHIGHESQEVKRIQTILPVLREKSLCFGLRSSECHQITAILSHVYFIVWMILFPPFPIPSTYFCLHYIYLYLANAIEELSCTMQGWIRSILGLCGCRL